MDFKVFFVLLIIGIGAMLPAKGQFVLNDFLASAQTDQGLAPTQAKIDFLKQNNFNSPWISRVEFRTRSNDANFSQEDFRFRITPSNPAELKANKRYYHGQVALLDLEYQEELKDALTQRYAIALNHWFQTRKKNNLLKQLNNSHQLISMMQGGHGVYTMDMGDLIDAQATETKLKLEIEDTEVQLEELEYMMKQYYNYTGKIQWSQDSLLTVNDIINLFREMKGHINGSELKLVKMEQKNALAAERFKIEKSESLRNIGYFQAEYDTDRGKDASRHFGYQIGLRIPIVNPDKPDLNRRKLALMDDQAQLDKKKEDLNRQAGLAALNMEHLISKYNTIDTRVQALSQSNFVGLQKPGKSMKISDLNKINEFYNDLMAEKTSVEKKIYQTYINYLNLTDKLSETPLRNYLSKNMEEL